nr:hypothetical protein 2 [Balneolaceae bacterium]
MAEITSRKLASSKDPMFGIDPENITPKITEDNWEEKATIRISSDEEWIYLWVDRAEVKDKGMMYEVCAKVQGNLTKVLKRFPELGNALEYANAEKGKFKETRPADGPEELPNLPNSGQVFFPNL